MFREKSEKSNQYFALITFLFPLRSQRQCLEMIINCWTNWLTITHYQLYKFLFNFLPTCKCLWSYIFHIINKLECIQRTSINHRGLWEIHLLSIAKHCLGLYSGAVWPAPWKKLIKDKSGHNQQVNILLICVQCYIS